MKRRLSLPVNKIKKLYLEGWTITKLAQRYYCSYFAMRSRLEEMQVLREKKHVYISPAVLKDTYELQGLTIRQIAEEYGVCARTVERRKKHAWNDIENLRNGKTTKYTPLLVTFLRREKKLKIREVADMMGITQRTVCNLQKKDIEELRKKFNPKEGKQ